jgi:hypothetical protein
MADGKAAGGSAASGEAAGSAAPGDAARDSRHLRPAGVSDATVQACGQVSEALESVERARGHLYELHQLIGKADTELGEAATALREAGHGELADFLEAEIVGRNVLPGRWTFQVVEEFDEGYWEPFRAAERRVRETLLDGRRHVYESEMKEDRRTPGRPWHASRPGGR